MPTNENGSPWENAAFLNQVQKLIEDDRILLKDSAKFTQAIIKAYVDANGGKKPTPADVKERLDALIWTPDRLKRFMRYLRFNALSNALRVFNYLPPKTLKAKAAQLAGQSVVQKDAPEFVAGINRFTTQEEMDQTKVIPLERYDSKNPFDLGLKDPKNFEIAVVNGMNFGIAYNPILDENPIRNIFRYLQEKGVEAVVLSGGLLSLDMAKNSGSLAAHRALVSGLRWEPEWVDPGYTAYREQKINEAKRAKKFSPHQLVKFMNQRERMVSLMGGLALCTRESPQKGAGPIYTKGRIFFQFGAPEELIIETGADWEVLHYNSLARNEVMNERKAAEAELQDAIHDEADEKTLEMLRTNVAQLLDIERRITKTNVIPETHQRATDVVRTIFIEMLQRTIPNSQFVSQGDVRYRAGSKTIDIMQTHGAGPATSLDQFAKAAGYLDLAGIAPDAELIAGAFNLRAGSLIRQGMEGNAERETEIYELPVAVNVELLRKMKHYLLRKASPVEKLFRHPEFEPGVTIIRCVDGHLSIDPLPIAMFLERRERPQLKKPDTQFMYVPHMSDPHSGHKSKRWILDEKTGRYLTVQNAFSTIMMREFVDKKRPLPFVMHINTADDDQGHHFETQQNRHPQSVTQAESEELSEKFREELAAAKKSGDPERIAQVALKYDHEWRREIQVRGEDWPNAQFEDSVETWIEPRIPFYAEIIKHSIESGISFRGIGDIRSPGLLRRDARDMGIINEGSGDHFEKTVWGELMEGTLYAHMIRAFLSSRFTKDELRKYVRAPRWGNVPIGYGLLSAPGGYEWALSMRHKLSQNSGKNGDRLAGAVRNLVQQGDYPQIFQGKHQIHFNGDIHFYNRAYAYRHTFVSCAPGAGADGYGGAHGFRRSNEGVLVAGIPASGPDAGPIRVLFFTASFLQRQLSANASKIDWSRIFRDSV
jgi:hypothetical protein